MKSTTTDQERALDVAAVRALLQGCASGVLCLSLASVLGALILAVVEVPLASLARSPLHVSLLLPFCLLTTCAWYASWKLAAGQPWLAKRGARHTVGLTGSLLICSVAALVLGIGGYLANVLFIDEPFSGYTLGGYVASALLAVSVAVGGLFLLRRTAVQRKCLALGLQRTLALVALTIGAGVALIDAGFLPTLYPKLHLVMGGVAMILVCLGAVLVVSLPSARRLGVVALALFAIAWGLTLITARPLSALVLDVAREPTISRRALILLRSMNDHDGDGFSAVLGGGDCDDNDASAFPLSLHGRDCLGWAPGNGTSNGTGDAINQVSLGSSGVSEQGPEILLLLTIDAFRCGFGLADRPELRDACPVLTALGNEGYLKTDAHASHPSTAGAVDSMLRAQQQPWRADAPYVTERLAALGYVPIVFATHPRILQAKGLRATFHEVDASLAPAALSIGGITSEKVVDGLLAHLDRVLRRNERVFLWGHFYDTHAPYVQHPGSRLSLSTLNAYVAEVRRTDAAIGRLFKSIRARADAAKVAFFVSADHGEEFGEHQATRHGSNLYEPATRVPFLTLRGGPEPRRGLPATLPSGHDELSRYLMSVATGSTFESAGRAYMQLSDEADGQVALVSDGWKLIYHSTSAYAELFDLRADPEEAHDLSAANPAKLRELGLLLGKEHAQRRQSRGKLMPVAVKGPCCARRH